MYPHFLFCDLRLIMIPSLELIRCRLCTAPDGTVCPLTDVCAIREFLTVSDQIMQRLRQRFSHSGLPHGGFRAFPIAPATPIPTIAPIPAPTIGMT